jgi:hypothetical protein
VAVADRDASFSRKALQYRKPCEGQFPSECTGLPRLPRWACLFASCAGTAKERMAKFEGLPLSAAIAKIGEPIDERWVAGKKVYFWGSLVEQPTKGSKQCQIRAMMNEDVIESFDYRGDETPCQQYGGGCDRSSANNSACSMTVGPRRRQVASGSKVRRCGLCRRWQGAKLAKLLARAPAGIVYNEHTDEDGATVFRHACKVGLEGIVSKRLSAYRSGPSRDWIKVKPG